MHKDIFVSSATLQSDLCDKVSAFDLSNVAHIMLMLIQPFLTCCMHALLFTVVQCTSLQVIGCLINTDVQV